MNKGIKATIRRCLYIKNDMYKGNLRTKIYLPLFFFKFPLLLKRFKDNRVDYRLFFILPILRKRKIRIHRTNTK